MHGWMVGWMDVMDRWMDVIDGCERWMDVNGLIHGSIDGKCESTMPCPLNLFKAGSYVEGINTECYS